MGESTQSMRPARCRSPRLANHHIWSVSGGRGPQHGRNDRGPRRVLGTRPPSPGLRPFLAHGIPRNIRSSRRQPATAESIVFSFEAIPFDLRIVPALAVVQTVSDAASLLHVGCQQPDGLCARIGKPSDFPQGLKANDRRGPRRQRPTGWRPGECRSSWVGAGISTP